MKKEDLEELLKMVEVRIAWNQKMILGIQKEKAQLFDGSGLSKSPTGHPDSDKGYFNRRVMDLMERIDEDKIILESIKQRFL